MMFNLSDPCRSACQLASMLLSLVVDAGCYLGLCLRPSSTLAAENLFLRKQQYCGQNLGRLFGNNTIVAKGFVLRAKFFQTLPVS
jgi:hypothetical protein